MLFDEGPLFGPDWVGFVHTFGFVLMAEESWLVGDDQILMIGGGALEDVEGGHHGYGYAGYRGVGVAGFEGVYGLRHPRDPYVILDGFHYLAGGGWLTLRLGGGAGECG